MEIIQIHARPHDLNKFRKRVAPYGEPGFIRCQIARDDVRGAWRYCTKISAATKVGRGIDHGWLTKVWILARQELRDRWAGAVALIAGDVGVDDVAAQSDKRPVFPVQIQGNRCYVEPPLNP
jgi:hypothetical protein